MSAGLDLHLGTTNPLLRSHFEEYNVVSTALRDGRPSDHVRSFGRANVAKQSKRPHRVLAFTFGAVQKTTLVRLDMRWIEAVRTHSEGEGGS